MSILAISPKSAINQLSYFLIQIHFYHLIKALKTCHFCVFEDCKVLPFYPKVEDLSRHPSIFKPHDDLGAKPKGFGENVKMCVCVFMFVCLRVYICALHMRLCLIVQVTNHCYVLHILRCNSSCLGSRGYGIEF